ncbi:tetratricopeptide repeat protein [Actinoplanes sp. N902-109]|uniref:tetratricopeptide repeat protein n=1 Tax=Actinoplanes sp. (strain N902-109) TaxID=649831 RepID=UPI00032960A7|nr:tetratricopeptide repeat protein [Actinoplanes sp. N902-109]AGL15115.1 TPR repeat-containing protein [Actinoplanes sp. N902-109]
MSDPTGTATEEAHGEVALARIALAEDDLQHAAAHLAGALTHDPVLPEVHEVLAELARHAGAGVLELFPIQEPVFIGTVVAHAHLLAPSDPGRALGMLAQATATDPAKPWADVSWVRALDLTTLAPQPIAQIFTTVMRPLGDPATDGVRAANEVYLDLARRATTAHPGAAMVLATAAGVGRRLGATAAAVGWGREAVRLEPSKLSLVWYAYALRADGRLGEGIDVLRDASRRFPDELDLCADLANWLAERGSFDEAQRLLEDAVRRNPADDCVVHTLHRLRFDRDGDARHLIALTDYVRDHPPAGHEHYELEMCSQNRPWLGLPAGPTEACINVLAQIPPEEKGLGKLALSALEVPSAIGVVRRRFPGATVEIAGEPGDLVTPVRAGRALWAYEGMVATPAVHPPGPVANDLVRQVVTPLWAHPVAAYDQALPLGQLPIAELLALLVFPPAPPPRLAELPAGWWERCVQAFVCLGVLHSAELGRDHPTDAAAHRRLLTELAFGLEDWITEAALFALVVAAWVDPSCRAEVRETVGSRFVRAVESSHARVVTVLDSLAELVLITPDMSPAVRALATDVLTPAATPAAPAAKRSWRRLFRR